MLIISIGLHCQIGVMFIKRLIRSLCFLYLYVTAIDHHQRNIHEKKCYRIELTYIIYLYIYFGTKNAIKFEGFFLS